MKKYLDEIIHLIDLQKNKSENITIVRLEGFENPIIYKEVCKYFKAMSKVNLHAKLSREKYLEFKNTWALLFKSPCVLILIGYIIFKKNYKAAYSFLSVNSWALPSFQFLTGL